MKFYFFSLFFISLAQFSIGQNRIVTGKVIDQCGNPVLDANIDVRKGTYTARAITNIDGSYTIIVSKDCDSIFCSDIKYTRKAELIEGNDIINFTLEKKAPEQYAITVVGTHKYTDSQPFNFLEQDNGDPYVKVELSSSFPGEKGAFEKYLKTHVIYPDSATIAEVKGVVKVGFTIEKDGAVKNIILIKGVNTFADNAVLHAIATMPAWHPAIQNGRNIEEYKEVYVSFKITGIN